MIKSVNILKIGILLLGFGLLFSFGLNSAAATNSSAVYVSTHGNDSWNGLNSVWTPNTLNGPKSTIKNATGTVKSGGTIYVANGTYFDSNIQINKNMSIIGQNQKNTIITGLKGTIFLVGKGFSLQLDNLTLIGGHSELNGDGGAINNKGFLTVNGVDFLKNYADNNGGAIFNKGTLNVNGCNFIGNRAFNQGGAILNDGKMNVTNSTFLNNNAGEYGGAIYNNGDSNLANTDFQDNTAYMDYNDASNGGAVYNTAKLNIIKSTFSNNSATNNGGAIFSERTGQLTISNTKFTKNYSTDQGYGGAIGNDGTADVVNSTFIQNTAIPGGAIANMGSLNLTLSTFNNNTAMQYGGAILNGGTLNINNVSFNNNTVTKGIGGSIANIGQLTITGKNSFLGNHGTQGGAIYNAGKMLINSGTSFTSNNAQTGGAIYNGDLQIEGTDYVGNATVINSSFKYNTAQIAGSILNEYNLTVENSTFNNNTAFEGGAVVNAGTMTLSRNNFVGNQGGNDGGAIINMNKAKAPAATKAKAAATKTPVSAKTSTAATSSDSDSVSTYLLVEYCNFTANSAINGGAICNTGYMTLLHSTFIGNIATSIGGAVSNHMGPAATSNTTTAPKDNDPIKKAAAIVPAKATPGNDETSPTQDNVLPKSTVTSCIFLNNKASVGSVIYNSYNLDVHFCQIIGNKSKSIIFSDAGTVNATLNWWGSNSNPSRYVKGNVTVDPWLVLNIHVNPRTIQNGETSKVTTDLTFDSNGAYHDPAKGHVPDGIPVKFTGNLGTLNPTYTTTLNGKSEATYTSKQAGTAIVSTTVDNQQVATNIKSTPKSELYLKITTTDNTSTVGKDFVVTYKLGNYGPDPATNVKINIPVPNGFDISTIKGEGSWEYNETSHIVIWTFANVAVGDPDLYITGDTTKTGVYVFEASNWTAKLSVNIEKSENNTTTNNSSKISVKSNESKNTIPMKDTGVPITGLVLGVLSIMGGIILTRKR
ncbi:MAG: hypothetical protein F8N15_01595 [Methanobacterium sp.]|nr:hypothetical protein [Methanobacterium sp.]